METPKLKVTKNSNKFRKPALHFQKYGTYCFAPKGTSEYIRYWTEEAEYCMNGYTAEDGDRIPGYHYFYLNYFHIIRVNEKEVEINGQTVKKSLKERDFPSFYDYDRWYFECVEFASIVGTHMVVLKSRRKGYSYKLGSQLVRNYTFYRESKGFAAAAEAEFLTKDGILTKAWDGLDFIDSNTAWYKKRQTKNTPMHKKATFIQKDSSGVQVEMGYKSEIIGITLKNDVQKIRGKAGSLIIFEEAGKFPNLLAAWQIARPSVEQGSHVFGTMIAFGTGGTADADFEGLKELFYRPSAYNCLQLENIWDEDALGQKCGLFIPQYANLEGEYYNKDNPDDPYNGKPFMDEDGNTIEEVAKRFILLQRQKVVENSTDKRAIDRHVSEQPVLPSEAVLNLSTNIFPKSELQKHLATIRNDVKYKNFKHVGNLRQKEDLSVVFEHTPKNKQKDITRYRLDPNDDPTGQIVIWEHPIDNAPWGLYVGGCLTPGEKVNTKDGLKNVEDITLDDKLINKDGEFVKINTLLRYEKENEPTHRIKFSNIYRATNFTQEHPLYVSNHITSSDLTVKENNFKFDFIRARNVTKGMWTKYPNYYRKTLPYNLPFDVADEGYFWWFVGIWLGDGWVDKDKVSICFNKKEVEYINRMQDFVVNILGRSPYKRERNNCIEFSFGHRELSKFLTSTINKGAANKTIQEWVKFIPYEYKYNLIQGYLDSDGCVTRGGHTSEYWNIEFVSVSQELLEGFQDILFSMGLVSNMGLLRKAKISSIEGRTVNQKETFRLRLGHQETMRFVKNLPFADDPKRTKIDFDELPKTRKKANNGCFLSEDLNYIFIQIKDIQNDLYTGTVYNFDCETHTFITPYCTTHNCDPWFTAA